MQDALGGLSEALAERARRARPLVACISVRGQSMRSGTIWRKDVVVASEQSFPRIDEAEIMLAGGAPGSWSGRVAGRDPGTNVIAFRLEETAYEPAPLPALEPQPGAFVLAFGADSSGLLTRSGIVHSVGPAWHSRAGGHIDRRITLDMTLTDREEGGPVLDAGGGLLGISTLGPRRRVLVIPTATVERVLEPLLSKGRIERGWLGLALQPVLVPEELRAEAGHAYGLMVMRIANGSPGAQAGVLSGDILVTLDREGVSRPSTVAQHLGPESVGRPIELQLIRAGKLVALTATIAARPLD
jgi:S1-C subfamily serine protease